MQASQQHWVFWQELPFAALRRYEPEYHGDAAKKLNEEGRQALRRNRNSCFWSEQSRQAAVISCMLDPIKVKADLRAYAESHGQDFDSIVEGAARHFHSPAVTRRAEPLTDQELESLFEDDQRAFGR